MLTITQIENAHAKAKDGSGFPQYIRDLIALGVLNYSVYLTDGHTEFVGKENNVVSDAKYPLQEIDAELDIEKFKQYLKIHQQGKTDYFTFCRHAAQTGVSSWTVDTVAQTCTYCDRELNEILVEKIPV